ncbi:Uncharacterised protein [Mycobacteroides abscessus subsp. abscessus]|nr:Uncharacterised protein [Mycobacteroides abscessus subsp. abscessus]SHW89918.1 Uncharacterised protein [Mycobacteroides abscessus subsp. abscessus]SIM80633.1 Uncharacterised protein [Mycobacteroides abscessus subsp. abscessus]
MRVAGSVALMAASRPSSSAGSTPAPASASSSRAAGALVLAMWNTVRRLGSSGASSSAILAWASDSTNSATAAESCSTHRT